MKKYIKYITHKSIKKLKNVPFALFAIVLYPILRIRTKVTFNECKMIIKIYLYSLLQHKHFLNALKVFYLLFFKVAWRDFTPDNSLFKLDNETKKDVWEIGQWYSIKPEHLTETNVKKDTSNKKYFSIGREAIAHILKTNRFRKKRVLLPNFTCFTVLDPFTQDGWKLCFYRYHRDLTIDDKYFREVFNKSKPTICIFQSLSGMGFNAVENDLIDYTHKTGCMTVVDQTQDIYNSKNNPAVDYYCGSLRKWYPFPDGAFLYSEKYPIDGCDNLKENNVNRTSMGLCMFARHLDSTYVNPFFSYLFRFMWTFSVSYIAGTEITSHTMSSYSRSVLSQQNETANSQIRIQNFRYIYQEIKELKAVKSAFNDISRLQCVPLSFPVYVKNRNRFSAFLRSNGISTQVLWGKPPYIKEHISLDKTTEFIYNHILSLPCDQRYGLRDMKKMIDVIREYDSMEGLTMG